MVTDILLSVPAVFNNPIGAAPIMEAFISDGNVELQHPVVIPYGRKFTLDMNGYKVYNVETLWVGHFLCSGRRADN